MIFNFNKFISEELKIDKMDDATLEDTKSQLMFRLSEYRVYILANINYNMLTNKIEYKNFDRIDIKVIMRELTNEYTAEFIEELKIEAFLRKINQILEKLLMSIIKRLKIELIKLDLVVKLVTLMNLKEKVQFYQENNTNQKNIKYKLSY